MATAVVSADTEIAHGQTSGSSVQSNSVEQRALFDPWIAFHEALLSVQQGALDVQRVASTATDFELRRAAAEIQKGAAYIMKAALSVQEAALFGGLGIAESSVGARALILGSSLLERGEVDSAVEQLQIATQQNPDVPEAHKILGDAYLRANRNSEAVNAFDCALALRPTFPEADNNLAIALLGTYSYDRAREVLLRMMDRDHALSEEMRRSFKPLQRIDQVRPATALTASPYRLIDHARQIHYLVDQGDLDPTFEELAYIYETTAEEFRHMPDRKPYTILSDELLLRFGGYFDKLLFYRDAARVEGSALNTNIDWKGLEEEYQRCGCVSFDNLLAPSSIASLRRFFLDSTVFFRHSEAGFVGSYVTDGFNCSLIFQIIQELHERLPNILAGRPLNNMWCYRYASEGHGVRPHNGDGSVTLNFWFTPDDANLSPGSGGMVMYDKVHPPEWDWLKFNMYKDDPAIQSQISEYLDDAKEETIPYGCNRAVLFHSTLFHKTDPFRFKDGFLNARTNITMLLGKRGQESARTL